MPHQGRKGKQAEEEGITGDKLIEINCAFSVTVIPS